MGTNLFICSIICMVLLTLVDTENLVAIRSSVNLPTARYLAASSYDGNDTITIVGGNNGSYLDDILEYKISTDSIRVVSTSVSLSGGGGSIAADGNGNLYYTGGTFDGYKVFKSNKEHTSWSKFVDLPMSKTYHGLVQPTAQTALLIGGQVFSDDITLLDMTSATATSFAKIPEMANKEYATAVLDGKGNVIIFSCAYYSKATVIKLVLATKQYTVVSTTFPMLFVSTSVRDGNFVYLTGALEPENYGGILQFDLTTSEWKNLPVTNHPVPTASSWGTSAIFVPQLNRVYFFGGYNINVALNEIWWIQLSQATTTEPTTTTDAASDLPTTGSSTAFVPCRDYENSVGIESVGFDNFLDATFQSYGTWLINNGLDPTPVNPTSIKQTISDAFLSLSAVYSNTAGSGMSNALQIVNIQSDFTFLEFSVTVELYNISIYGLYTANGTIISLYPIEGKGKYELRYTNLEVSLKISGFGITEGYVNLGIYDSKETVLKRLDGRVVSLPDLVKPEDADGLGAEVLNVLGNSIETILTDEEKHPVVRSVWGYLDFMFAKTPLTEIIATKPAHCI